VGFTREDFPLEGLAARLEGVVDELEHGRGCALLRGLDPGRYSRDELRALYWGIGVHVGTPISQNAGGELMAEVTDGGREYRQKNVRGYTTNDALRAHCDASDVVTLLCVHPARRGGESVFTSSVTIFNEILRRRPDLLAPLAEGFHFDLRGEGATGDPDEVTRHRVPVFSFHEGVLSARFNQKTLEDGQRKSGSSLDARAREAVQMVADLALREDLRYDMRFEAGAIQLLNNHTVLHARTAFEDWPEARRRRLLLRLWLNLREGRALHPRFAERLNTGPRGGVAVRGVDY
jgi:hypothetical protein